MLPSTYIHNSWCSIYTSVYCTFIAPLSVIYRLDRAEETENKCWYTRESSKYRLLPVVHIPLLGISRQLACMKLGSREIYQPIQYCWVHTCRLLGYLVHTCHLPIDIQQVSCSTPDRTAFALLRCMGYCNLYTYAQYYSTCRHAHL